MNGQTERYFVFAPNVGKYGPEITNKHGDALVTYINIYALKMNIFILSQIFINLTNSR